MEELKEGLDSLWESIDRHFAYAEKLAKLRHETLLAKLDTVIANNKAGSAALPASNAALAEELEGYERRLRVLELNARDEDRTV